MADVNATIFGRRCRLLVVLPQGASFSDTDPGQNALEITGADDPQTPGLRIVAKVTKTSQKEPNTAEVTVYNLAPASRAAVQRKGVRLVLEAGYTATGLAQLFVGDVRIVDSVREGPDWKTTFKCGDGERSFRYARASESFAAGVTVGQVVAYCANQMGLSLGNTGTQASKLSTPLYQGWTAHGAASSELDRILRSVGYAYSIQNGQVQVLAPNESVAQSIPDLTPETGLLGSPEMGTPEKKGKPQALKFQSLLLPEARPGGRVHVKSERYDGIFRLRKVEHDLDVRGGPWWTNYEGVSDASATVA